MHHDWCRLAYCSSIFPVVRETNQHHPPARFNFDEAMLQHKPCGYSRRGAALGLVASKLARTGPPAMSAIRSLTGGKRTSWGLAILVENDPTETGPAQQQPDMLLLAGLKVPHLGAFLTGDRVERRLAAVLAADVAAAQDWSCASRVGAPQCYLRTMGGGAGLASALPSM